jgi:hypothetical protein
LVEVQNRLDHLETVVRRHEQTLRNNDLRLPESDESHDFLQTVDARTSQSSINSSDGQRSANIQESFPENASTDGMVITYTSEEDSGYFGIVVFY